MTFHVISPWRKYENSRSMEVFQVTPRKCAIQTWFCNCPQYLCLFHIVFECSPSIHDQGKMLVLPNRLLYLMSSTYTDKNNPFSRCTNKHSQLETFSQPCCNAIFSNCLSHNSTAKGWPYRFRSRGTTGSSILDHDLRHLCRGKTDPIVWTFRFWNFQ